MNVYVEVLCFNLVAGLRHDLIQETVDSLLLAFPTARISLHDNCSTDGATGSLLEELSNDGSRACVVNHMCAQDQNSTPGAGRNRIMKWCELIGREEDSIVVFSDDDMSWKEGAEDAVRRFWSGDTGKVVVMGGLLEPVWHWNTPRRAIESGGVKAVVRDSCPGAAMTFPYRHWKTIGPVKNDFGYDYDLCCRMREKGHEIAQMDLATHAGWGRSTHGNEAIDATETRPFDKKKWGLE